MKATHSFSLLLAFLFFIACGGDVSSDQATNTQTVETPVEEADNQPITKQKPNCELSGIALEGNIFWAKEADLLVCITADETTKDEELGDSHRILEIYESNTCELLEKITLPVDVSPDYGYSIADRTYNHLNQIVAIKGFSSVYCYDAKTQILSEKLTPKFINERFGEDSQSGMITHLEVWEDYLIGYAQDMGTFVFNLSGPKPESVEPFAEFEISEGELYNSMFMLKSGENAQQIILPRYDFDNDNLTINTLFEKPKNLVTQMNKRFRNNRFIILKENIEGGQNPIAVDMRTMVEKDLPEQVQGLKNAEIIEWLKAQD